MGVTVIGGVGYRHLRDHSVGIRLSDDLEAAARPPSLLVEDLSYNPVAVAQWLLESHVDRLVLVTAVAREDGRPPGTITAYRWDQVLPQADDVQRAVTDAVTGIIHLDNTLVVTGWMGALPRDTCVVEVEALEHGSGDEISDAVGAVLDDLRIAVLRIATDDTSAQALPVRPLGGRVVAQNLPGGHA